MTPPTVHRLWLDATIERISTLRGTAEGAIAQLSDEQLHQRPDARSNSVAIYMHHLGGNHLSRFTDWLETDGEKASRDRDAELDDTKMTRNELLDLWERGWDLMASAIAGLSEEEVASATVRIRGEAHTVPEAVQRALTHAAGHVGQIVTTAKLLVGENWRTLSVPSGGSAALNRSMGYIPGSGDA